MRYFIFSCFQYLEMNIVPCLITLKQRRPIFPINYKFQQKQR